MPDLAASDQLSPEDWAVIIEAIAAALIEDYKADLASGASGDQELAERDAAA
jgi:hypothetical protein